MTEEEFDAKYKIVPSTAGSDVMEWEEARTYPANRRWTFVDTDSGEVAIPGDHYVNRFGYMVTTTPWISEDEEVHFATREENS